ncbi:MAG: hypothetical protein P4M01_12110 [Acidobacteriota bacterium]|nr:hypothetical protein [Acidobacteriota bacterium]
MRIDRMGLMLLLLAAPLWAQQSTSLGDAARDERAAHQSTPRAQHVYTNDDLQRETPTVPAVAESADSKDAAAQPAADAAKEGAAKDAAASPAAATAKPEVKTKTAEELREEREKEYEKRNREINKTYTDRIQKLREQMNTARLQLAKLATAKAQNMEDFRRSVGTNPSIPDYNAQQHEYDAQISAQKDLISSLNAELEDAMEAARHAGVRVAN